jgi:DNA-binding MarR family transcriptional regulator
MSTRKDQRMLELADRLHSAAIHLLRRLRIRDLASGVGPAKLSALSVLVFQGRPLSLAELAAAEQVKNPTMSRLVAAMEKDRLVKAEAAKHDARSIQITPTARGKALLLAGKKRRVESLQRAVAELGENEIQQMEQMINILRDVIRRL